MVDLSLAMLVITRGMSRDVSTAFHMDSLPVTKGSRSVIPNIWKSLLIYYFICSNQTHTQTHTHTTNNQQPKKEKTKRMQIMGHAPQIQNKIAAMDT